MNVDTQRPATMSAPADSQRPTATPGGAQQPATRTDVDRFTRPHAICIVGGAGHIGLPVGLVFASVGNDVTLYDINRAALDQIAGGTMPFQEDDADSLLVEALANQRLHMTTDPSVIADAETVLIIIGTPVDEFMNPSIQDLARCIDGIAPYLRPDQLLVLQSTVYPGTAAWVQDRLDGLGVSCQVAYCPERVVQGQAVRELRTLPQIVSGTTPAAEDAAAALFGQINDVLVRLSPIEAELVKLYTNAYRYIEFAIANQLFMLATEAGVDYYRVRHGMTYQYPRMGRIPTAGFAAGPCLYKDTAQLGAFSNNAFGLGASAILTNEGLPLWVVERIAREHDLSKLVVGILGAAFKAESDDARSSLSYKLRKILLFRARDVLMTDPYVKDERLVPLDQVLERSDILIVATPHRAYRDIDISGRIVVDVWNFFERGRFM